MRCQEGTGIVGPLASLFEIVFFAGGHRTIAILRLQTPRDRKSEVKKKMDC